MNTRSASLLAVVALTSCSRTSASPAPSASSSEHAHELHLPPAGPTVSVALDGKSVDVALASLSQAGGPTTLGQVWKAAWPSEDPAPLRFDLVGIDGFRPMSRPKCTRLLTGTELVAGRIDVGTHDVSFDDALGSRGATG
jgi:hypothetical protein